MRCIVSLLSLLKYARCYAILLELTVHGQMREHFSLRRLHSAQDKAFLFRLAVFLAPISLAYC